MLEYNIYSILKFFTNFLTILIVTYFSVFLGVILLIIRYIISHSYKGLATSAYLFLTKLILVLLIYLIKVNNFNLIIGNVNILQYFSLDRMSNSLNIPIIVAIILTIIFRFIRNLLGFFMFSPDTVDKLLSDKNTYINNEIKRKEDKYKSENTNTVTCSSCGATNIIVGNVGKCKYCRKPLSNISK